MNGIDFTSMVLNAENEIAVLSNALHLMYAYENRQGELDIEQIKEDEDFGTFDSLNEIYVAAKNLIKTLNDFNDNL